MTAITETEAAQRFESILDAVGRGEIFEVMRAGEHLATITPPRCAADTPREPGQVAEDCKPDSPTE